MRRWEDSTFIFISTNQVHHPDGVEERWLHVMQALTAKGATVRFLCVQHSAMGEWARALGIPVDPYILDKWNVIRSRSRLRKYLRRYSPVCAHSTGLEGDLLLRWAARKVPEVRIAHALSGEMQKTRRRRPINAMMLRLDELGMRSAAAVVVDTDELSREVQSAGVPAERVIRVPADVDEVGAFVDIHLELYRSFMAGRGAAR